MASIDIVICVTGTGESVGRCLGALAVQRSPRVWLAFVGSDETDARAEVAAAHAATPRVRVLRSSGPGLAAARNAALAASGADVLAFVEDDVVVAPDWFSVLQGAWDAAPDRVAAIGGPIELDLRGRPPRWFSEALHAGYATLDYGPLPLTLDPAARTLHGGNLSVRCAPLRALGGFWPAYGHGDGRDWFSEEHYAQRELDDAGWQVRYEPAARASRVPSQQQLTPARVLRRRWRYGARMAISGRPQPPAVALSQAASSAAGAAMAAAQRRPALAVERAARAAQSLGVLAGRPLAARDFRPTGPRPFGNEIPRTPVARRPRIAAQSGSATAAILLYHRVADPASGPDGMCVSPDHFDEQLRQLSAHPVLELAELAELARAKRVPAGALAVSFDDGYEDMLVNARPRLATAGIPATVFVTTGHVADQRPFFWDELRRSLTGPGPRPAQLTLSLPDGSRAWRTDTPQRREKVRRQIHDLIQPASPAVIDGVLAELAAWTGAGSPIDDPRAMTLDELRALAADPLIAIGAHTVRHSNLGFQSERAQREEIERSRSDLEKWLGSTPVGFSYPFGIPDVDFHAGTRKLVADAGFRYAVANHGGAVSAGSDPFALPRHFVPDLGAEDFAGWLRDVLRG
jgi:peptidoglycan/xylan/chitin deacetylase (PgdA/CDA1 family)